MSEGGKPGITARVQVSAVSPEMVIFRLQASDADYFQGKEGQEFMAKFVPIEEKKDGE